MDLGPRQTAFLKSEMEKVETDDTRQPTVQIEASRIREKLKTALTE
jgi:hypothetical protein